MFCKDQCQSLCPGKLRVRCATCSEGYIVLQRVLCTFDIVKKKVAKIFSRKGCKFMLSICLQEKLLFDLFIIGNGNEQDARIKAY